MSSQALENTNENIVQETGSDSSAHASEVSSTRTASVPVPVERAKDSPADTTASVYAHADDSSRKWWVVDAKDQVLGRLAVKIADRLRGKDTVMFTKHVDNGDYVVVINAAQVRLTGDKERQKKYYRHSGYPGGISETTVQEMRATHPERIIYNAVKGMLPKNRLARQIIKKLRVCADENHPYVAQNPQVWQINP